jgi:hypothetical protein
MSKQILSKSTRLAQRLVQPGSRGRGRPDMGGRGVCVCVCVCVSVCLPSLVDAMGGRIDELERNIGSLLEQAGVEDEPSAAAAAAAAAAAVPAGSAPKPA